MTTIQTLNESVAHAAALSRKYRECLLKVGKSPDYHIYDLSYDFLRNLKPSKAASFLTRVRRFYDDLSPKDQRIFIAEVLELNRHYPFWFLGEKYRAGEFEQRKAGLLSRVGSI